MAEFFLHIHSFHSLPPFLLPFLPVLQSPLYDLSNLSFFSTAADNLLNEVLSVSDVLDVALPVQLTLRRRPLRLCSGGGLLYTVIRS